ncbi:protein kinase [Streptomyces sp. NPDC056921]|uniref:protein kinase domain-containing protein n=1 Tax=Streptomyces sp. NPDC056921 TaxID=3345966 RepID=UPI0036255462
MERGELVAGRYELLKRLGRGGMGEVWAGRDRVLRRDVAVKMLVLDEAMHADLPRRFEREAVAAAQINHPNVVALYDRGIHEDLWFLVMERVEGTDLGEHIRDGEPMDPARALGIGATPVAPARRRRPSLTSAGRWRCAGGTVLTPRLPPVPAGPPSRTAHADI